MKQRKKESRQLRRWLKFLGLCLMVLGLVFALFSQALLKEKKPAAPASVTAVSGGEDEAWQLILVNRWNPLPEREEIELAEVEGGETVDRRIYAPLQELFAAAKAEGLGPVVVSGYRTAATQREFFENEVRSYREQGYSQSEAEKLAGEWVALPGTSEHELGLAVDINGDVYEIYEWLAENSWKYGFINRYPQGKTELTGVANEPWHFRYVGKEAAEAIYNGGLCLEEYLKG